MSNQSTDEKNMFLLDLGENKIPKDELDRIYQILEKRCSDFFSKYNSERKGKPLSDREIMITSLSLLLYWDEMGDVLIKMDEDGVIAGRGIDLLKLEKLESKYKLIKLKNTAEERKYSIEPSYDFERNFIILIKDAVRQYNNSLYIRKARLLLNL